MEHRAAVGFLHDRLGHLKEVTVYKGQSACCGQIIQPFVYAVKMLEFLDFLSDEPWGISNISVSCSWVMIFNQTTIPIEIYLRRFY